MRLLPLCFVLLAAALLPAGALAQTAPPTATTGTASPVGLSTTTVHGTIDPNGQPVSYRFEYGTTTAYGLQTADDSAGFGDDPVSVSGMLAGLTADTVYHYRLIAWPDADPSATVAGADRTFHTIATPTVSTNSARAVGPNGVTLDGKADPNRSATTVRFEWGTNQDYGNLTAPVSIGRGSSSVEVSTPIAGLSPNTTYHFRIVATNAAGVKRGRDRGFRTSRAPTGITLAAPAVTVGFGRSTTISGQVQGAGVNGIRVALESAPFPFTAPFTSASSVVTAASNGTFRLATPPLLVASRLHVVTRSTPAVASPDFTVSPTLIVGISARRRDARRYRLTGAVTPHVRGAKVSIQRKVGAKWRTSKRTLTKRLSRGRVGYDVNVLRRAKTQRYRVLITPRTGAYARTASRSVKVLRTERKHRHEHKR
jgi:hypothetical protein